MNKLFEESIIESKYFEVHQDWECPIEGFFILSPKRKIRTIDELTEEEQIDYIKLIIKVRKVLKQLGIRDVYFFQNEDTEHDYHLWIFSRLPWMEEFGRKIQSVRKIMNYAKENLTSNEEINKVKEFCKKARTILN